MFGSWRIGRLLNSMESEEIEGESEDGERLKRIHDAAHQIKGCLDLLAINCNITLAEMGAEYFKDAPMQILHDVTSLAYFDEINKNAWSADVKQMMDLEYDVCDHFLKQYREDNMPVDTIIVKIGDFIIGRMMVPSGGKHTTQ